MPPWGILRNVFILSALPRVQICEPSESPTQSSLMLSLIPASKHLFSFWSTYIFSIIISNTQMAATSSVSHPAVPEFQKSLPKYLSLPAFLSPTFSASLFPDFSNRLLPCFPSVKMPNLPLTPDTSQWCHLPLVKLLSTFFMVLHNSSLALNPLYSSCSHELASSSHIFSHLSMLVFTSGTPSHF